MCYIKILLIILGGLFIGNSLYAKPPIFLDNYNDTIKISENLNHPIILIFSADWCHYCIKLKNDISRSNSLFQDTTICILDIDDPKNNDIVKKYNVHKIPKTIFFDANKKIIKQIEGYFHINGIKK